MLYLRNFNIKINQNKTLKKCEKLQNFLKIYNSLLLLRIDRFFYQFKILHHSY